MHSRRTVFGALALAAGAVTLSLVGPTQAQEHEKKQRCQCCPLHGAPARGVDFNQRFQALKASEDQTVVLDGRTGVIYRTSGETVVVVDPVKAVQLTRRLELRDERGVIQGDGR